MPKTSIFALPNRPQCLTSVLRTTNLGFVRHRQVLGPFRAGRLQPSRNEEGELAQLARALAWHARGHEFDSRILHLNVNEL